jgi:hypothetical protein
MISNCKTGVSSKHTKLVTCTLFSWRNSTLWAKASSLLRLHDHTQTHTTVGRTPLDEWWARRRDLYLTTHNNHKRQTSMPAAGFEFTMPGSERPQTLALDRAATGSGALHITFVRLFYSLIKMTSKIKLWKQIKTLMKPRRQNILSFIQFY